MAVKKKILLVYKFNHPDVESVRAALAARFPKHALELLNIKTMVKKHPGIFMLNIFYMFNEYPLRHLLGYWKVWRRFWATTYMHRQVRRLVGEHVARGHPGLRDASLTTTSSTIRSDYADAEQHEETVAAANGRGAWQSLDSLQDRGLPPRHLLLGRPQGRRHGLRAGRRRCVITPEIGMIGDERVIFSTGT